MAGINLILENNPVITAINCGTSSPRLGGTVDISAFPNLGEFRCNSNDITALSGYENNSNIRVIEFFNNKVTGSIPSLSAMTNLTDFRCYTNLLTGTIPSLSGLTNLRIFWCNTNLLTGSIPSLDGLTNLRIFWCNTNRLTGLIPSLSGLSNLRSFQCGSQTGPKLTGSIPSLNGLNNLDTFWCFSNQLTGFVGGSVSNTLGNFQAQSNQLTQTTVNTILSVFVAAGRTTGNGSCVLNLGGTNSRPSGQGVTDVTTLRNRGWTVTTGTALL